MEIESTDGREKAVAAHLCGGGRGASGSLVGKYYERQRGPLQSMEKKNDRYRY
jgi:hypothetical protein